MRKQFSNIVAWYDRHEKLNTIITAVLFSTQLLHLFWLATHVLAERIFGEPWFNPTEFWQNLIIIFDYFEIPALLSATLLYGRRWQKNRGDRAALRNLIFINLQYLHIFWITDEFAEAIFTGAPQATILPAGLALAAIVIDYLELPVMYQTFKDAYRIYAERRGKPPTGK